MLVQPLLPHVLKEPFGLAPYISANSTLIIMKLWARCGAIDLWSCFLFKHGQQHSSADWQLQIYIIWHTVADSISNKQAMSHFTTKMSHLNVEFKK